MTIEVPLSFYNTSPDLQIVAPEMVAVTFGAKKSELRQLDLSNTAIHVDARMLHQGVNRLDISHKNLLLPHTVTLVNYRPVHVSVGEPEVQIA